MRILVSVKAIDGRKGIDSLAQVCRQELGDDPFSGCIFVFRTRSGHTLKILVYDGQGFWMAQKRLSKGRFKWWPDGETAQSLQAHQLQVLFAGGDPRATGAPVWRPVRVAS